MEILNNLRTSIARKLAPEVTRYFESRYASKERELEFREESLNTVQLELENLSYQRLTNFAPEYQFTKRHVLNIVRLAVQMAIKNPITVRSVNVQADYIFGQGVSFIAKHPAIQAVIDEFVNYCENQKSFTSHPAMLRNEKRQQVYGSMFFALNTNPRTGRVIVRWIPTLNVEDVICNPDDKDCEWYIKRSIGAATDGGSGGMSYVYHPAYGITESLGLPKPWEVQLESGVYNHDKGEILWNAPVLHVASNRLGQETFAIPEVYPQLDWALAYKRSLEQYISTIAAFARMVMKVTGLSGRKQAAAAKGLLQTSVSLSNPVEGNPSPVGGSLPLLGKGLDVEPIKTAGATTPASDADPILNFAGCAVGLPNTFYGDAGKGNFATAKTLDRPTEFKMTSRQKLWIIIFSQVLKHAIEQAAIAPEGMLNKLGATVEKIEDPFTGYIIDLITFPVNDNSDFGDVGKPINPEFEVYFPEILERNVADRVRSLVNAVTLFGKPLTDIVPDKRLVSKMLLQALNVPNADKLIPGFVTMWEKNMNTEPGVPVEATIIPPPDTSGGIGAEDAAQGGDVGENG